MSRIRQSLDYSEASSLDSSARDYESISGVDYCSVELFVPQPQFIKTLPKLLSLAFGSVLRCAVYELAIIDRVSKVAPEDVSLDYIPLEEKLQTISYEIEDDYEKYPTLVRDKKFQKDRTFMEKCLKLTSESLQNYRSYDILEEIIENFHCLKEEEDRLLIECIRNKHKRDRLRILVDKEREQFLNSIQATTENVGNIKDEINDTKFETEAKTKFLLKWEHSRQEQQDMILNKGEQYFIDVIRKFYVETNQEERVHTEIVAYLKENAYDNENETEMWMERYDKELEEREISINEVKIQIERQQDEHAALLEEYNKRGKEIEAYLIYKEEKRKEAEELARRVKAAIRIQAWWRGTMFRKGLGPYKKKKKGKKKGSAGNKKSPKKKKS